jgi:hypothetical protein
VKKNLVNLGKRNFEMLADVGNQVRETCEES